MYERCLHVRNRPKRLCVDHEAIFGLEHDVNVREEQMFALSRYFKWSNPCCCKTLDRSALPTLQKGLLG